MRTPRRTLEVPVAAQQAAVAGTLRRLGVEQASWRVDVSAHPFTAWIGRGDSRVTTRYSDGEVESLLSSLHEYGHALYERQIDPALDRTNLGARHLDVDPRVPEQAVGEPRRAQPRVRGGARGGARAPAASR